MTPRRLYVIILRTFVILPSTPFNLNDVESESRRSAFRSQHEEYYPVLSGTLPLPQVTMAKSPLIIPSHFTTQMDMLKSGESDNQAKNLPGYLLSDIKRRSLSLLLDRIPRKKGALLLVSERQSSVAAIGNGGWRQRSMISVVTFV